MKTTNETCCESNYSSFFKEANQKNSLGYFPLLKFKENLYSTCQSKFSEYINSKNTTLKLIINNKINQKISINDYLHNSLNDMGENKLTPIPSINKRKIKNEGEKKELKNFQRNVVLMRRLEYANKMKEKNYKKKYKNKNNQIIFIQKMLRGYLVRKIIKQIHIINETLTNFIFLTSYCIKKKYFYFFKNNISQMITQNGYEPWETDERLTKKEDNLALNINNLNIKLNNNDNNINRNDISNKLTNNENIYEQGENIILKTNEKNKNKNNPLFIDKDKDKEKEQINLSDDKTNKTNIINNLNEIHKYDNNNFNINDNIENYLIDNDIGQEHEHEHDIINNNIIKNNNKDNIVIKDKENENEKEKEKEKEKKVIAKVTNQLNEIKNENNEKDNLKNKNTINYNSPNNLDSVIENDDYIDFSGKLSVKKNNIKINKNNVNNNNLNNITNTNKLNYVLPSVSINNLRKVKTETIQRQFRKYLIEKGYYGYFDKRKIAIIYLLKNMILCNIRLYTFNILKLIYKEIKNNITVIEESDYFNLKSERIENVKQLYNIAYSHLKD